MIVARLWLTLSEADVDPSHISTSAREIWSMSGVRSAGLDPAGGRDLVLSYSRRATQSGSQSEEVSGSAVDLS